MRRLLAGACALALTGALPSVASAQSQTGTLFVQAGRLLADPATGKVETAKTVVIDGGRITRIACGITISRSTEPRCSPSEEPASIWPLFTDKMPARTISAMKAAV